VELVSFYTALFLVERIYHDTPFASGRAGLNYQTLLFLTGLACLRGTIFSIMH
jgi:hypothetical protein